MGVVARKLRIQRSFGVVTQQITQTRQIGGVGSLFARKYGVALQAQLLADFDLGVPVGPFDQANGDLVTLLFRQFGQPAQYRQSTLGIGLDNQAKTTPPLCNR